MRIQNKLSKIKPLDKIIISDLEKGNLIILDGEGREYLNVNVEDKLTITVGGSLGTHFILLKNETGVLLDSLSFVVDCKTEIDDDSGYYKELLDMLYFTMIFCQESSVVHYEGKSYKMFVRWIRDHVHTLKGMKYFYSEIKEAIDFFAKTQREDGMIYDNIYPSSSKTSSFEEMLRGYFHKSKDKESELRRVPVENDVEYLFVEGIYYTWQATGDNDWMVEKMNSAISAFEYTMNDKFRWSEKYQLLKRGFTIDTWDFQSDEEVDFAGGFCMSVNEKTRFGIMHGDNTGFARSCEYLSEMLEVANRSNDAIKFAELAKNIKERLSDISWNGDFFTHHIPEDENINRDFGVDLSKQVSLSNAYALNRNIKEEHRKAIIQTYQKIKTDKPQNCQNEYFLMYPPFKDGAFSAIKQWQYMNGGTSPIVAGELAHGAFENGFEEYGIEILKQMYDLAKKYKGFLHCCFTGKKDIPTQRKFDTISLKNVANIDIKENSTSEVTGWTKEGDNDFSEMPTGKQEYHNIPFDIVNPDENSRKCAVGLSVRAGYKKEMKLSIDKTFESVYLLHTKTGGEIVGVLTFQYEDGEERTIYIKTGKHLNSWWIPHSKNELDPFMGEDNIPQTTLANNHLKSSPIAKIAWNGKNKVHDNIGSYVCGINNPYPNKKVKQIIFNAAKEDALWAVFGVSLSDKPVFFSSPEVSGGIPANWGAAAVVYALIEGLGGIKDLGVKYDKVLISPKWAITENKKIAICAKYEASNSYVSYKYEIKDTSINIDFTGSASNYILEILLPKFKDVLSATLNGKKVDLKTFKRENSTYASLNVNKVGSHNLEIIGR